MSHDLLGDPLPESTKGQGFTHEEGQGETVEWYTPPWLFEVFGLVFDLDPCYPHDKVLPWIPARNHYTIFDDGLKKPWQGLVWCNPPYGDNMHLWMARMADHNNGLALVFSRTETDWFQDHTITAAGILFLNERIRFIDSTTLQPRKSGPGAGSIVAAWGGASLDAILKAEAQGYGRIGYFTKPMKT